MNNTIKLAVASALLAAASNASAGIMIPAGDWTLDIGGVVNAYYTSTRTSGDAVTVIGGVNSTGDKTESNITTGLLPNYLSVSGKTRQNDLDVAFTISINPGASTKNSGIQGANQENRQAFLTFGDASWGSIKLGKDLGIYASDAILNDMTLLGVGSAAGGLAGNTTTLGRIGTGFMYADWKSQVAYSSPNWNGFSFTAGVTQAWNAIAAGDSAGVSGVQSASNPFGSAIGTGRGGSSPAFEGKASYAWAGDFAGKVWVSGLSQKVEFNSALGNDRANAWDMGATVNVAGFGLTGYYGQGEGTGTTVLLRDGFDAAGNSRDSDDWYVQGTYTLPGVGTKLGVSYGESTLDGNSGEFDEYQNSMWTVGAYHPLTKHLNLVAEYSDAQSEINALGRVGGVGGTNVDGKSKTIALGAILFF
ncbi:MAG: porin [Methylotenera sp.]|uniref:porin n=1 Tax=Methylotenera sp. TaxID=2051956 RepID=UPI0024891BBD|nr:porin [Methylotenera sp.]MDI1308712.1 porin [Methylotenera sp.]